MQFKNNMPESQHVFYATEEDFVHFQKIKLVIS